ncbi:hypothetical protein [Kitasatospora sp. NPDC050543]|uniref:hypothetical protein n=1 Tax=Kitasatospora sp. NPDC050543 TaxID=3364054 RepID=UPI0037A35AC1
MRVLAYELRRLRGLRSTWILLAGVLLCDAAVAALLTRQLPAGQLTAPDAVRSLTAAVPLLPLPIAALGAGALGALSYGHEVRHPGLPASRVPYLRRARLLLGKLAVTGVLSALLAGVTVLLDAVVTRFVALPGVDTSRVFSPGSVAAALGDAARHPSATLGALGALGVFTALVVGAGATGVLTASLTRSATAGFLLLCAVPALFDSALALLVRRAGAHWAAHASELLPARYGYQWAYGARPAAAGAAAPVQAVTDALGLTGQVLGAALVAPVGVLLLLCLLVQTRRREL